MISTAVKTDQELQHDVITALGFENAAHSVAFEQFEKFGVLMRDTVLPETYARP